MVDATRVGGHLPRACDDGDPAMGAAQADFQFRPPCQQFLSEVFGNGNRGLLFKRDVDRFNLRFWPFLRGGLGEGGDAACPGTRTGLGEQTEGAASVLNGNEDAAVSLKFRGDP